MTRRVNKLGGLILGGLGLLLVAGCGFKSTNQAALAVLWPKLNLVTIASFDEMGVAVGRLLEASNIKVYENAADATNLPSLTLDSSFNYYTSGTLTSIGARFYRMRYVLNATLKDASGKVLWQRHGLEITRDILLQPNEIFEHSNQVKLARREMCQEMASKLMQALLLKYENQAASVTTSAVKSAL